MTTKTEDKPKSAQSLKDLCKSIGGMIPENHRVYFVTGIGGEVRYVLSNSPGQAAMTVVKVETCSGKEVTQAAFEALAEMQKASSK